VRSRINLNKKTTRRVIITLVTSKFTTKTNAAEKNVSFVPQCYCFRKLTQITDNGKTTAEQWHYFIAFFQLQLRKNNGKRLGT
jgi:hypothetical protein